MQWYLLHYTIDPIKGYFIHRNSKYEIVHYAPHKAYYISTQIPIKLD